MFTVFVLLAVLISFGGAVCPQDRTDLVLWSSQSTWMQPSAVVVIPQGMNVLLDVSANITSLTINGDLVFKNTPLELTTTFILINTTGRFFMGSDDANCAITSKIIITLYGPRVGAAVSDMGFDPFDGNTMGSKGIGAVTGSTIQIVGSTPTVTWTRLSQNAANGSKTLNVEDTTSWSVGDQIVISSTDYSQTIPYEQISDGSLEYTGGFDFPSQSEKRTITSISGKTITLDSPLTYTHWGQDYERAEVGLLTHNIVIQGDASSETSFFGGHIMIRLVAVGKIQGVELVNMGQRGILGRYPLHFHRAPDSWGYGYYIKYNSVHDSFQRCFTIHETNQVVIEGNVAFNTSGHCYFLEDGSERGNTFNYNLGILSKPIGNSDPLVVLPTDNQPSMYWITNPNNTFTNNVAVEAAFGFWFAMPYYPTGFSALDYPQDDPWVKPRLSPLGGYSNNIAHSNALNGHHIDNMVDYTTLMTQEAAYTPYQGPYNGSDYLSRPLEALFDQCVGYKNRGFGVWCRGNQMKWTNLVVADNMHGFNAPPGPTILINAIIIGETANIGTPLSNQQGRTRPGTFSINDYITGWETYDNGGGQYATGITFINLTTDSVRPAGALSCFCAPFLELSINRVSNITFINSNKAFIAIGHCSGDNPYSWSLMDQDGSVTGTAGWSIVSNNSLLYNSDCVEEKDWNGYSCPPPVEGGYVQLRVEIINGANLVDPIWKDYYDSNSGTYQQNRDYPRVIVHEFGASSSDIGYLGVGSGDVGGGWDCAANLKPRRGYSVNFGATPTPPLISLQLGAGSPKDWIIVSVPYPSIYLPLNVTLNFYGQPNPIGPVNSLAELVNRNQYYYDNDNQNLYLYMRYEREDYTKFMGYTFIQVVDGWSVVIQAACYNNCVMPTSSQTAIPPALPVREDLFMANLEQCQTTSGSTTGTGSAVLYIDSVNYWLSYKIVHSLSDIVTNVTINKGAIGTIGTPVLALPFSDSPITYYTEFSRSNWIDLLEGNLYIVVSTTQHKEHIRGQIGCSGSCSLPAPLSSANPCTTNYGNSSVSLDPSTPGASIQITANDGADTFNTSYIIDNTTSRCGNSSVRLSLGNGAITFVSNANLDSTIKYLQFYAKLEAGTWPIYFRAFLFYGSGQQSSNTDAEQYIPPQDIDTIIISDEWARIRVPISQFNFYVPNAFSRVALLRETYDPASPISVVWIDEVRFIPEMVETMIPNNITVYSNKAICTGPSISGDKLTGAPEVNSSPLLLQPYLLIVAILYVLSM